MSCLAVADVEGRHAPPRGAYAPWPFWSSSCWLFDDPETTAAAAANPNLPIELMVAILDAPINSGNPPPGAAMKLGHTMSTHEPLAEI